MRETAITFLKGLAESSDGLLQTSHTGIKARLVVIISVVSWILLDNFVHPFLCFIITTKEVQGILTAAAIVSNRILLDYHLKIRICLGLLALQKEKFATHQIEVWIVLSHLKAHIVVLHGLLSLALHLIGPTASIVAIALFRSILYSSVEVSDSQIQITVKPVVIATADIQLPIRVFLHSLGYIGDGELIQPQFAVAIRSVYIDLVVVAEFCLKLIIGPHSLGILMRGLIELAEECHPLEPVFSFLDTSLDACLSIVEALKHNLINGF